MGHCSIYDKDFLVERRLNALHGNPPNTDETNSQGFLYQISEVSYIVLLFFSFLFFFFYFSMWTFFFFATLLFFFFLPPNFF